MDRAAHRLEEHEAIVATLRGQCNAFAGSIARRYAGRVGRWGIVVGSWLVVSVLAAAHPAFVPTDPPAAFVQADPGRTTFALTLEASGWTATLARSVADACDVVAVFSSHSLFDVRVRALVLSSLFPFRLAVEAGWSRVSLNGALHLGPVRLVGSRCWGADAETRVAIHAFGHGVAAAVGAEIAGEPHPFIAATWFPDSVPLWSVTLAAVPPGWRLTLGGTW